MPDSPLSTIDRRMIDALQVAPRAPWSALAPVVGVDASTLARRWRSLTNDGIVWTSVIYGLMREVTVAVIELDCLPQKMDSVIERISQLPSAMSIDVSLSNNCLVVTFQIPSSDTIERLVLSVLSKTKDIRAIRTHLVTELVRTADQWRVRALSDAERAQLPTPDQPDDHDASTEVDREVALAVLRALETDVRTPIVDIARQSGFSQFRIHEALTTMQAQGRLQYRVDVIRSFSGWPTYAWYFVNIPGAKLRQFSREVSGIAEVRFAATAVGGENFMFAVWLRSVQALHRFEAKLQINTKISFDLRRAVIIHTPKHFGHLLDERGRCTSGIVSKWPAE